mgnify:CR=1 FL=1
MTPEYVERLEQEQKTLIEEINAVMLFNSTDAFKQLPLEDRTARETKLKEYIKASDDLALQIINGKKGT